MALDVDSGRIVRLETIRRGSEIVVLIKPATDGMLLSLDAWDELVPVVEVDKGEVELMLCGCPYLSARAFAAHIAPPTIAPITIKTTRPLTTPPLFVCQKG